MEAVIIETGYNEVRKEERERVQDECKSRYPFATARLTKQGK
jgi:hypothetical protein